ncbi:fimbrial protein [Providencia sneebia]|uniref:Fimbrial protein n=1 Tax=Providencia sneebia DSM 19967 TaxID=1141660 RepID=K8WK60_9GAMM|nr:fimbrial protein [Providencia sneebia]EKT60924.1 fimbrial protein [Providencia sneebia DSM 19967]
MLKKQALSFVLLCSAFYANADCETKNPKTADPITINLSELLYQQTSITQTYSTKYMGFFECDAAALIPGLGDNKVINMSAQENKSIYIKLNNQNIIKLTILNINNKEISLGSKKDTHSTSKINTNFSVKTELYYGSVPNNQLLDAKGASEYQIKSAIVALDASNSSLFILILKLLASLFVWEQTQYDIYYQPLIIKFEPKQTTCSFDDAGMVVKLPNIERAELLKKQQAGETPFALNFSCESLLNGKTNNPITAYLSSSALSPDKTIMLDKQANSAKGVGISVKYQNNVVHFGTKQGDRNGATLLINKKNNDDVPKYLSVPLVAYYNVYDTKNLTAGAVKTTAILNMEYF